MAKVDFEVSNALTPPVWLSDWGDRRTLLPGGVKVVAVDFTPLADGRAYIPAGTLIGRTWVEAAAGTGFSPAETAGPDDEVYLVAFDVMDALNNNDCDVVRPESLIKENLLPDWATRDAAEKAVIRATYQTQQGVA